MPGLIKDKALGLIETIGLVGAIEACDAASKAADVIVSAAEVIDPALVTIKIFGELGAVQAAVAAGSQAATKVGQLLSAHIIPNPDGGLEIIMSGMIRPKPQKTPHKKSQLSKPPPMKTHENEATNSDSFISLSQLEKMRVSELRNYARNIPNLGIKGREISRADKDSLLREIKKARGL